MVFRHRLLISERFALIFIWHRMHGSSLRYVISMMMKLECLVLVVAVTIHVNLPTSVRTQHWAQQFVNVTALVMKNVT